jgi:hypothetical protein
MAFTDGHPTGKHLVFSLDANFLSGLIVVDVDASTIKRVPLGAQGFGPMISQSDYICMSYDSANNRVLVVLKSYVDHSISYYSIGLPADPMSGTGYTVSLRSVAAVAGGMPVSPIAYMYSKNRFHEALNCILVPTTYGRMLGFVPSA